MSAGGTTTLSTPLQAVLGGSGVIGSAAQAAAVPLWADREVIVATVAGSTTHRAEELARLLDQVFRVRAAQAEAGRRSAAKKSARVRAPIVKAIGALPLSRRDTARTIARRLHVHPTFAVPNPPCDEVIRDVLRQERAKRDATTLPST